MSNYICDLKDCNRPSKSSNGKCVMHYTRWLRYKSYDKPQTRKTFNQPEFYPKGKVFLCKVHGYLSEPGVYRRNKTQKICKQCVYQRSVLFAKKRRKENPEEERIKLKRWRMKGKFGLTQDQYDSMLSVQKGLCAICNNPETRIEKRTGLVTWLSIDHCHLSNKIRGLLCARCNLTIGAFKDDTDILQSAINYLKEHQE